MTEYIEREAVAKLIKSEYIEDLIAEWYEAEFDNVYVISKKELLDIPAADVRPVVKAVWIWDDEGYHCSECFHHAYGNTGEIMSGVYHYCPNCGADMRETN